MKIEDLVVLRYAQNECYTSVVAAADVEDDKFNIDLEKQVWSYREWENRKIGQGRPTHDVTDHYGIIGVYDRTNTNHLDSMVHDASESVRERHVHDED